MITEKKGKVIKGLGGLFDVLCEEGEILSLRAKGILKRDESKVLVGDDVTVSLDDTARDAAVISEIATRKNALIRPPISNLDYLFIVFAAAKPTPVLETVDKLTAIAYHNDIIPVIIVTKSDVSQGAAEELAEIYRKAGMCTFITSAEGELGLRELSDYIKQNVKDGKTAAFAGASGVGKSTLMNALFPNLSLSTGDCRALLTSSYPSNSGIYSSIEDVSTPASSSSLN